MLDPRTLYTVHHDAVASLVNELQSQQGSLMLVHALTGFVNAGSAVSLTAQHIFDTLPHDVVATFSIDELLDYRSRRPTMTFEQDHYSSFDTPHLAVHAVRDDCGKIFLLLAGPEPDTQWERFVAAVHQLIVRFEVDLTVGIHAIGMAVPHTRPLGIIGHATRASLVPPGFVWPVRVHVPGSAAALLEYRLGEAHRDALGFVVRVPHYLAETSYPDAALVLLERLCQVASLSIPQFALIEAAEESRVAIAEHVSQSVEAGQLIATLEEQYDSAPDLGGQVDFLTAPGVILPSADELGAEVERFLAEGGEQASD
ncbi:MAG: proteasome assembly chaperone family protein [Actinomycetota bacterium]